MQNKKAALAWSNRMESPVGTPSWTLITNSDNPIYTRYQMFLEKSSEEDIYHIVVVDKVKSDRFCDFFNDCAKNLTVYEAHCKDELEAKNTATALYAKLSTEKLDDPDASKTVLYTILSLLPPIARKAVCEFDFTQIKQIEGPIMGNFEDLEIFKEAKVNETDL